MFRRAAVTFAAVIAVALVAPVGLAADGMTPDDIARLQSVNRVAVAPDGRHVAYTLTVPRDPFDDDDGAAWSELRVVDPAGRERGFVTGEVNVGSIAWLPDGGGIVYVAKRTGDDHDTLWMIPIDGGESRRLLEHDADIEHFAIAADGTRLAFSARQKQDERETKLDEQGFDQEVFEEDWRPLRVWIAELEQGRGGEPRMLPLDGSAHELSWHPDGTRLAVALSPTPLIDDRYMKRTVRIVDAGSGEIVGTVEREGKLGRFAFSPDGAWLALLAGVDLHDPNEGRLLVVPAAGGAPRDLLPSLAGDVQSFAWRPDGTLVYVADVGVRTSVGRIAADGRGGATLVEPGGPVLANVSLSRDGRYAAFTGEAPDHPTEVFGGAPADGAPRRLTTTNPWLADVALARQEVVRFAARDGLELEGILVHPLERAEGERVPLVMIVHGGPESHHRDGWQTSYSRPAQVLAARGFAVFLTNYRGSTGRGVAFSTMSQGDFAGKEFDDVVDAVDHLVARGLVDRDRVGVTGGSYGGYATAWLSTYYSERFAAGVMSVGISDLLSKVGTSDIPNELYLVHMRTHVWDDWELMLERSPIRYVEKARTPLLILHGREDTRVFPGQSLELYRYLTTLGRTPVRLVWYPREGHGNRRAPARLDYSLRLLRWMEHYLQGDGGPPPAYALDYGREPGDE